MANPKDLERALSYKSGWEMGDPFELNFPDLSGYDFTKTRIKKWYRVNFNDADLRRTNFTNTKFEDCSFENADFRDAILIGAKFIDCELDNADFREANLTEVGFYGSSLHSAKLEGANLFNSNIPLSDSSKVDHEGETKAEMLLREEKARREEEQRARSVEILQEKVSKAKSDKELEALAQEVGSLQAQPEYVREYGKVLNDLQAEIEEKYSLLGKASRYLKKLFSRGRRASQVRVASQMLNQLNKEIRALKRDLDK